MATKPTPGGSDGTYGTEMNAFLDESLASDGKIKTEALQTDATAPVAEAALVNRKFVIDQILASGFQNRGDPFSPDFAVGDLITDNLWHDLDLSSIIGSGSTSVLLRIRIQDGAIGSFIQLRKNGNLNTSNSSVVRIQTANSVNDADFVVACDADRVIEYIASNVTFEILDIIVKAWWI